MDAHGDFEYGTRLLKSDQAILHACMFSLKIGFLLGMTM